MSVSVLEKNEKGEYTINIHVTGITEKEIHKKLEFVVRALDNHNTLIDVLKDFADVVEVSMVHGDIDLPLWIAKVRHAVALAEGNQAEADFQQSIIDTEGDLV